MVDALAAVVRRNGVDRLGAFCFYQPQRSAVNAVNLVALRQREVDRARDRQVGDFFRNESGHANCLAAFVRRPANLDHRLASFPSRLAFFALFRSKVALPVSVLFRPQLVGAGNSLRSRVNFDAVLWQPDGAFVVFFDANKHRLRCLALNLVVIAWRFHSLGLLTVLARPIAVAYGHNIATSSMNCKRI